MPGAEHASARVGVGAIFILCDPRSVQRGGARAVGSDGHAVELTDGRAGRAVGLCDPQVVRAGHRQAGHALLEEHGLRDVDGVVAGGELGEDVRVARHGRGERLVDAERDGGRAAGAARPALAAPALERGRAGRVEGAVRHVQEEVDLGPAVEENAERRVAQAHGRVEEVEVAVLVGVGAADGGEHVVLVLGQVRELFRRGEGAREGPGGDKHRVERGLVGGMVLALGGNVQVLVGGQADCEQGEDGKQQRCR